MKKTTMIGLTWPLFEASEVSRASSGYESMPLEEYALESPRCVRIDRNNRDKIRIQ